MSELLLVSVSQPQGDMQWCGRCGTRVWTEWINPSMEILPVPSKVYQPTPDVLRIHCPNCGTIPVKAYSMVAEGACCKFYKDEED